MTNNTDPVRALISEWRTLAVVDNDSSYLFAADKLEAALAQQPAAPSAPVGVERLRRMVEKLAAHVRPTCSELWEEAQAALSQQPAAVGDWVLVPRTPTLDMANAAWRELESQGIDPEDVEAPQVWDAMLAAAPQQPAAPHWGNVPELDAQQPAAPSGEAVAPADGIIEQLEGERDRCNNLAVNARNSLTRSRESRLASSFDWAVREIRRLAAPQQPAGVDEAMVERAVRAAERFSDEGQITFEGMRAALAAALATQHQEPKS